MACEHCCPAINSGAHYDHGFDLPDVRVQYEDVCACDSCEGDGRIHFTLNGKTVRTLGAWDRETRKHKVVEWADVDVRPLTEAERGLPQPGHWDYTEVAGHHHVHKLTEDTFIDECGDCDGTGKATARGPAIYVKREWYPCECGHGTDYRVTFRVRGPAGGDLGVWFSSEHKAETWVGIEFPSATVPEYEDDGEGWLRRAEGWG